METLALISKARAFKLTTGLIHLLAFMDSADGLRLNERIQEGRPFVIAGNGGSMCDALHFAEELTGRYRKDCSPYGAFVLGANPGHLTCVANDYGYDEVFIRDLRAYNNAGMLPFVIYMSTSGTSPSITKLREYCAETGAYSLFLTSKKFEGEPLTPREIIFKAEATHSDIIQELHMTLLHSICELITENME